jgi:molybdopterin-binding protein
MDIAGVRIEALCEEPPGSRARVIIHPEEVVLLSDSGDAGSARNRLRARVVDVRALGALVKVDLDCGFPLVAYVTTASRAEMGIERGRRFTATVKATSIHVLPYMGPGA